MAVFNSQPPEVIPERPITPPLDPKPFSRTPTTETHTAHQKYLETQWIDAACLEEVLSPSYYQSLRKWNKFASSRIIKCRLMEEHKVKKNQAEQARKQRKSSSNQHVQKNGVIYKGDAVRQIEERRVQVTNQALVRKCKEMDKIWATFIKQLPKLVENYLWDRLCLQARYDSRVVELIPLYRTDSCE
jgi:hypothetical protein